MLKWILSLLVIGTTGCVKPNFKDLTTITFHPQWTSQFAKTSVKVLNTAGNSGGSGVIVHSDETGSRILTNKHVCGVIQSGGIVRSETKTSKVESYKLYAKHDLCLIRIADDLGINLGLPAYEPAVSSDINVSGHPALLPHIRSRGHLSDKRVIQVMIDTKKCDGTEKKEEAMYCFFLGGTPVIREFESQLVSALIMPGSSGSGVFTDRGELMGLVFAGAGEGLSYGSIVPFKYLKDFLENEAIYASIVPDVNAEPKNFLKLLAKSRELCATRNKKFRKLCAQIRFQPIWQQ